VTTAPAVLAEAPGRIRRLAADKGYDADWLRADLRDQGITPVIPSTRARKRKVRHDQRRYRERWRICRWRSRIIKPQTEQRLDPVLTLGLAAPDEPGRSRSQRSCPDLTGWLWTGLIERISQD
jgi:IS5 family transposase